MAKPFHPCSLEAGAPAQEMVELKVWGSPQGPGSGGILSLEPSTPLCRWLFKDQATVPSSGFQPPESGSPWDFWGLYSQHLQQGGSALQGRGLLPDHPLPSTGMGDWEAVRRGGSR